MLSCSSPPKRWRRFAGRGGLRSAPEARQRRVLWPGRLALPNCVPWTTSSTAADSHTTVDRTCRISTWKSLVSTSCAWLAFYSTWDAQLQPRARSKLPDVRAMRIGVHVSMGSRQAVRAVGTALGLEAPRVNALARLVPLLSSPGAIEEVMTRTAGAGHPRPVHTGGAVQHGAASCGPDRIPASPVRSASIGVCSGWTRNWIVEFATSPSVGAEHWARTRQVAPRGAAFTADDHTSVSSLAHLPADPARTPASDPDEESGDGIWSRPVGQPWCASGTRRIWRIWACVAWT